MTQLQTPSFRLDGKTALVTGGSKGIGLAMAVALAQAGADVTIAARDRKGINEALLAHDALSNAVAIDITDTQAVKTYMAGAPVFDILVNNAGLARHSSLAEMTEQDYDAVMDLNVRALMLLTREWVGRVQRRGDGRPRSVINVSSQMGHVGGPRRSLYCASKHALEGFTKALAWEVAKDNIRANTLCPTFIETELTKTALADPAFKSFVTSKIARGTLGNMAEVMGPVVFLASDASSLMTGSALMLDGGWTAV